MRELLVHVSGTPTGAYPAGLAPNSLTCFLRPVKTRIGHPLLKLFLLLNVIIVSGYEIGLDNRVIGLSRDCVSRFRCRVPVSHPIGRIASSNAGPSKTKEHPQNNERYLLKPPWRW